MRVSRLHLTKPNILVMTERLRRAMATPRNVIRLLAVALVSVCLSGSNFGQASPDALKQGFESPPQSAKPRVWWHWMNGNISKEGIKLDLEWMHRVGVAGFQNF